MRNIGNCYNNAPAKLRCTHDLTNSAFRIGNILQDARTDNSIKAFRREREQGRRATLEQNPFDRMPYRRGAGLIEHAGCDIAPGNAPAFRRQGAGKLSSATPKFQNLAPPWYVPGDSASESLDA